MRNDLRNIAACPLLLVGPWVMGTPRGLDRGVDVVTNSTTRWSIVAATALLVAVPLLVVLVAANEDDSDCGTGAGLGQGLDGPDGVRMAGLNADQLAIARITVQVGEQQEIPENGIVAALMAALTESTLHNDANTNVPLSQSYSHDSESSDDDSLGPWQLRASVWGPQSPTHPYTMGQLMDPREQARWFFSKLTALPGYQTMDPAAADQAVENSRHPERYRASRPLAEQLYRSYRGAGAQPDGPHIPGCGPNPGTRVDRTYNAAVLDEAKRWLGWPYEWGGGGPDGPTLGGFDCSGLVLHSEYVASGGRILLDHYTGDQQRDPRGVDVPFDEKQPGDAIYFTYSGASDSHHVALYDGRDARGDDLVIDAPDFGQVVKIEPLSGWKGQKMLVRRFGTTCRFSSFFSPSHENCTDSVPPTNQ